MSRSPSESPPVVAFGGVELPLERTEPHFFFLGMTGSGKTLSLRMLMQSVLVAPDGGLRTRAIVYDAKRDALPVLLGMGIPREAIKLLCPSDRRSVAWDMAADIRSNAEAFTLAKTMIPDPPASTEGGARFYIQTAQALIAETIVTLRHVHGSAWTFHDLIRCLRYKKDLRELLYPFKSGREVFQKFFETDERMRGNVEATLMTDVAMRFSTIAHVWKQCQEKLSLEEWISSPTPSILVLAPDPRIAAVDEINQVLFRFTAQILLSLPERDPRQSDGSPVAWMILDEFRFAGELPLLGQIAMLGRSKGIRLAMAAQSFEGVVHAYGRERAYELLANAANLAVLRLAPSPSANDVAKIFGEYEAWERDQGETVTHNDVWGPSFLGRFGARSVSRSYSSNLRITKREAILPGMLSALPEVSPRNGIDGYFATPGMGLWRGPIPWSFVEERLRPVSTEPGHDPRPPSDYDEAIEVAESESDESPRPNKPEQPESAMKVQPPPESRGHETKPQSGAQPSNASASQPSTTTEPQRPKGRMHVID